MSRSTSATSRLMDKVEKTLALIKPEAMEFADDIEELIKENGFEILLKLTVRLTPDDIREFYKEHASQPYFPKLLNHMMHNNIMALCLSKVNAISEWKRLIGPSNVLEARVYLPGSIRAKYGMCSYDDDEFMNAVHGSENTEESIRELNFFFPTLTIDPQLQGNYVGEYLQGTINPTLTEGLNELCKEKPADPIIWLADWLLTHNPNSYPEKGNDDDNQENEEDQNVENENSEEKGAEETEETEETEEIEENEANEAVDAENNDEVTDD